MKFYWLNIIKADRQIFFKLSILKTKHAESGIMLYFFLLFFLHDKGSQTHDMLTVVKVVKVMRTLLGSLGNTDFYYSFSNK